MKKEKYEEFCNVQSMVQIEWNGEEFSTEYAYKTKQHTWLLQDGIDNVRAVDVWCEQFDDIKQNTVFVIFGAGNSDYLVKLCNKYPDHIIVVFEPCDENVLRLIDADILKRISNPEYLVLIAGTNRFRNLEYMLYTTLRYENLPSAKYASLPNYKKIWEQEYEQFYSICKYVNEKMLMDRNTNIMLEESMGKNYLYHIKRAIGESDISALCSQFLSSDAGNYPAVLVAAGPSLDKNVLQLKEYQNRMFIVCVDAALNTLYKHHIVPDIVVSVDPRIEEIKALKDEEFRKLPVVTVMTSSYKVFLKHEGRLFYEWDDDAFTKDLLQLQDSQMTYLESGGSVANNAFSLLRKLGFRTIVLIGQDLAYPNGKFHAADAFENEGELKSDDDKYFYVEDIYGGQVLTEPNMDMYRKWYEKRIENYKEIRVIDATEGGALIRGTEVIPLDKTLEECCPKEEFDFKQLVQAVPYLENDVNREQLEKQLLASKEKIAVIQKSCERNALCMKN